MKLLRTATAIGVAAVLATTATACGGSSEAATGKDEAPSAPAPSSPPAKNVAEDTTTLRELNKLDETPATLADATLILVDYQNTYTEGVMELDGWKPAVENTAALLKRARAAKTPVIHIVDKGYDLSSEAGQIIPALKPAKGEPVVEKSVPNGFHDTNLAEEVKKAGRENVIIAGFMTNMCTLFTTQGAFLNGNHPTVVADASATRPLPLNGNPNGIPSEQLHASALATVQDLYGVVVPTQKSLK
ncbi:MULTISPECIES: isochorismatase family protein [unclassified Streptomyces]|uniref:isochorismatase family protein n=1 Tax=unclassified Streptomyces TaxID=2593676 RepID=UPI000CD4B4B1|nr:MULTISPECIES: isochorismatase family protein [unclassified Streptomyces]MCI4041892.1 isochorismatase family protein [Streptomyces sp. TRM75563]